MDLESKERIKDWGYAWGRDYEIVYLENIYKTSHIKRHPYHIVKASMAPLLTSLPLGIFVLSYFQVIHSTLGLNSAIIAFILGLLIWGISINYDSLLDQQHTFEVKKGIIIGMLLFIASEVMFFFSFFWSFFYISLSPTIAIGCVWPPYGLHVYNYLGLPLLNTVLLLLSGAILTDAYTLLTEQKIVHDDNFKYKKMKKYFTLLEILFKKYRVEIEKNSIFIDNLRENFIANKSIFIKKLEILKGRTEMIHLDRIFNYVQFQENRYFYNMPDAKKGQRESFLSKTPWIAYNQLVKLFLAVRNNLIIQRLFLTLLCAFVFLYCQGVEYVSAPFSLNDGIYGSLFFLLTGFHGFHVLIGSILISITTVRFLVGNFNLLHVGTKFEIFKNRSTGFACTLFYWHFVDVVWLFLYVVIYWWSSSI
uniref:Cytochrome c oxidase subunit 3 n=1 Tax=Heterostelium pallidum TaxID=13642 RepID=Q5ILJ1_HETPA|nr:cytochrome c oxidase subunit 3 [Heterostelium pallidum]AAU00619.1 cytochrome c oxidase subunit 3 [Heterostelium pallidum]